MSGSPAMNFQAYLEDTFRIIKEQPVILIIGGLIVQLLTIFSMGILAGPLMGGYLLLIIYYLRDNRKPSFNDIFSGLQRFAKLFPYFLVLLLILIGFMFLVLPGLLLATWWLYVLPLMVDRRMPFNEAMRLSMSRVNETGFLMHFVFLLLITVIPMMLLNFLSTMIPFLLVLKILLPPFQAGCLAGLYIDQFHEKLPDPSERYSPETTSVAAEPIHPGPGEEGDSAKQGAGANPTEAAETVGGMPVDDEKSADNVDETQQPSGDKEQEKPENS